MVMIVFVVMAMTMSFIPGVGMVGWGRMWWSVDAGVLADAGVLPRDGEARVDEAVPAPIRIEPVLN